LMWSRKSHEVAISRE